METKHFHTFLKILYPSVEVSNKDALQLGEDFKAYLIEKFKDNRSKLEEIWNINPMDAIMGTTNPLKTMGYHSALVLHFSLYVEENKKKAEAESLISN